MPAPRCLLLTGAAGFIGFHLARRMLAAGWRVIGVDSLNDYYDVGLKARRRDILLGQPGFRFIHARVEEPGLLRGLMAEARPERVVHLAAQAGVRHSIDAPRAYVEANMVGTFEVLEAARAFPPGHLLLASSSSVYGANTKMPYAETDKADTPLSFYAATKKAGEVMAHSYAHLYGLPVTMLRFFTVYGPWGRPDMALFKFTRNVLAGLPIDVYNNGDMARDFTFVGDLVVGLERLVDVVPGTSAPVPGDSLSDGTPWRLVNIGHGAPVRLLEFIRAIEAATGRRAVMNMMPMQAGDVPETWADGALLRRLAGDFPQTPIGEGVEQFVKWYRDFYGT